MRTKFPPGSQLEMLYHRAKPEADNLAMAHVYGNNFSSSEGKSTSFSFPACAP